MPLSSQLAVFGGGCFWCTEGIFQRLRGVQKVTSGYAGGNVPNPSYESVCSGNTGHAEVIQIEYDPTMIEYKTLLEVFFHTHNPTTLNSQGNDAGTQYRSIILFTTPEQKTVAETYIQELTDAKEFSKPIVTEVQPLTQFYPAEEYHQNYFNANGDAPYCQVMIAPKIQKLLEKYGHLVDDKHTS